MSDVFTPKALDTIPFRQPQPMTAAVHPGRGFASQETVYLPLSIDEWTFRRLSTLDILRGYVPRFSGRFRTQAELPETFALSSH